MGRRILVIDDEQGWRDLMSFELKMSGYDVITAQNGEDGIKRVQDNGFKLVVVDIRMPGIDGVETIKRIKTVKNDIKFIMVTGYAGEEKLEEGINLGAHTYFYKPLELDRFVSTVQEICN